MKNKDKTKPIFGLDKIPDSVLLKMALVENGKLKAYIDELEYEIKELRKRMDDPALALSDKERNQVLKETRKEKLYTELRAINKALWERYKKLKKRYDELLSNNIQNHGGNET